MQIGIHEYFSSCINCFLIMWKYLARPQNLIILFIDICLVSRISNSLRYLVDFCINASFKQRFSKLSFWSHSHASLTGNSSSRNRIRVYALIERRLWNWCNHVVTFFRLFENHIKEIRFLTNRKLIVGTYSWSIFIDDIHVQDYLFLTHLLHKLLLCLFAHVVKSIPKKIFFLFIQHFQLLHS